jgi:hypothetical protein
MGDFDFLTGSWTVANRTLTKVFVGCEDWSEFPATARSVAFFEGAASVEEIVFSTKELRGMSVRLFDPASGEWSIRWASSGDGVLLPPVVGRFTGGIGTFYGDEPFQGGTVRVRNVWSGITPTSARWEQAYSNDGEQTWETNWTMDLTRVAG